MLSGTSMATPFIAGSSALYLQTHGKVLATYLGARYRFESTAVAVPSSQTDGDPLQTLSQQGAGLIQVYNAVKYATYVTPGKSLKHEQFVILRTNQYGCSSAELLLNDTNYFNSYQEITVENTSAQKQTYKITHVPAGTTTSFMPSDQFAYDYPVPLNATYATVLFTAQTLSIPAGGSKSFYAQFAEPHPVDPTEFPVYSGQIRISSANETVSVSYLGVAAPMKKMKVLDKTDVCKSCFRQQSLCFP